ncbi:MAG: hypothetical protein K5907_03790, partial [Treponema sp.]|nr:hypothetical protein [Treponema sp.]
NIKNFYDYLSKNKELQKKLSNKIKKVSKEDTALNIITNIAKKENYFFSVDELREFVQRKSQDLSSENNSDQELSKVAGGKNLIHSENQIKE